MSLLSKENNVFLHLPFDRTQISVTFLIFAGNTVKRLMVGIVSLFGRQLFCLFKQNIYFIILYKKMSLSSKIILDFGEFDCLLFSYKNGDVLSEFHCSLSNKEETLKEFAMFLERSKRNLGSHIVFESENGYSELIHHRGKIIFVSGTEGKDKRFGITFSLPFQMCVDAFENILGTLQ